MKQMQCIIVDDDSQSSVQLRSFCERVPFINLQRRFDKGFDVIDYLNTKPVDLLICKLQMPDINGLELVASLKSCPEVIFTAEDGSKALEAYDLGAIDYLVNPDFSRFLKAVNRAWRFFIVKNSPNIDETDKVSVGITRLEKHMFIKSGNRMVRISFDDILLIEGYGDYIKIHTITNGVIISPWGIRILESKLPAHNFIRVHRSYIVAIDKIEEVEYKRIKIGPMRIPVGETFAKRFFELLGV